MRGRLPALRWCPFARFPASCPSCYGRWCWGRLSIGRRSGGRQPAAYGASPIAAAGSGAGAVLLGRSAPRLYELRFWAASIGLPLLPRFALNGRSSRGSGRPSRAPCAPPRGAAPIAVRLVVKKGGEPYRRRDAYALLTRRVALSCQALNGRGAYGQRELVRSLGAELSGALGEGVRVVDGDAVVFVHRDVVALPVVAERLVDAYAGGAY